jgi:hypothetical protein
VVEAGVAAEEVEVETMAEDKEELEMEAGASEDDEETMVAIDEEASDDIEGITIFEKDMVGLPEEAVRATTEDEVEVVDTPVELVLEEATVEAEPGTDELRE